MAGHVKDIAPNHDDDITNLFEKYTVDEIRNIEKKTRQNIEKKKEDLRQMVGERYRDLIEAADTITEMKKSADNVTHSIARIQDLCSGLKQALQPAHKSDGRIAPKDSARKSQQKLLFSTSINFKLIMDMPERIWSALDLNQYLLATRLYLLAKHIYNTVQLDPTAASVAGHFPLLARQWASICHFKAAILQYCRFCLRDTSASDSVVSECLGSIFLLEDQSMEQVFSEFVTVRANAVEQLFSAENSDSSVRSQVCDVFRLVVTTVYQIYSVFCSDEHRASAENGNIQVSCNMLVNMLKMAVSKGESGAILSNDAVSAPSRQYLSKAISDFRPLPRCALIPVSMQVLVSSSKDFLNRCVSNAHDGLAKVLNYVNTIKGLAAIRDDVWNLLKNDERLPMWDVICSQICGRHVDIWSDFAKQTFVERIEDLLRCQFDSAVSTSRVQIGKVLTDLGNLEDRSVLWERDLSSYIWVDNAYDISNNIGSSTGKLQSDSNPLMMKACGYTPAVQSLCRVLDQKLKTLLDDAVGYIQIVGNQSPADHGPFDRFEDKERIQKFVQISCEDCVNKQLNFLQEQLNLSRQQLLDCRDKSTNQLTISRVLLIARYASALCDLSPYLHLSMSCQFGDESALIRSLSKKGQFSRAPQKSAENASWASLRDKLSTFSQDAFRIWVYYACDVAVSQFKAILCDETSQNILTYCTQWDSIEIEEETEDDRKIKSTIRVPNQVSWYAQNMLYNVCEDINQMGGQAVHSSSLNSLVHRLTEGILDSYEQLLNLSRPSSISQTRSLQLLFDLKFLITILGHKDHSEVSDNTAKRIQSITDRLESNVDPFDLDVFSPYIQNHLSRHNQRSNVLFGLLIHADRRSLGSAYYGLPMMGTQQDQHNVLPLASCQNRFPLLPLSVQSAAASGIQPIIQPPKSKNTLPPVGSSVIATQMGSPGTIQPSRNTSSSFLEQMSTMWFSGGK